MTLVVVLVLLLALPVAAAVLLGYRLVKLRRVGTVAVLLRTLPADLDRGWRHGTIRYSDAAMLYYRLTSLRPGPDNTFARNDIEITGRRQPVGSESEILDGMVILGVCSGGADHELAMSPGGVTALQSWLESRRSARSRRLG